jgi:hypothetical protein
VARLADPKAVDAMLLLYRGFFILPMLLCTERLPIERRLASIAVVGSRWSWRHHCGSFGSALEARSSRSPKP